MARLKKSFFIDHTERWPNQAEFGFNVLDQTVEQNVKGLKVPFNTNIC